MLSNSQTRLTRYTLLLLLIGSLGACGFRLRGPSVIPVELKQTRITGIAEFSPLALEFSKTLLGSGATVVKDEKTAQSTISISNVQYQRRVLTVDALGRVAEYELNYQFEFKIVTSDGTVLVPLQKIALTRDYRFDPDNVLAKDTEEAQIRRDMISFAVRQAMRRIDAILKSRSTK